MSSIRLSLVIPRRFFRLTFAYSKQEDYGLGFTRSIYCKPKIIDYVSEDGSKVKLYSGLVDNSVQPLTVYMREIYLNITYKADFSLPAIEKRILKRIKEKNRQRQKISDDDFKKYGLDLAVAHMICRIGGRVQFAGSDYWYQAIKDVPADLPISTGQIKLETIDASCTSISYEGFDHLSNLTGLLHLRLRRCGYVDDFCLSRVGRIASLSFLDLSECPKITANGLASLSHLRNLRYLSLDDNPLLEHRELVSLLLEDKLPHLYIQGVEYVGQLPADSLRRILALAPPNENPLSEDNRETGDSTLTLPTSKDEILSLNQGPPPTDSEARLPHKTKMDDNTGMDYRDLRKLVIE